MNLNLFDNIDGLIIRERENNLTENPSQKNISYTGEISPFPPETPLAMAYVPFQNWGDTKSAEDALESGTLFSQLVFPFEEGGGK